jgi:hypothetical protein
MQNIMPVNFVESQVEIIPNTERGIKISELASFSLSVPPNRITSELKHQGQAALFFLVTVTLLA